MITVSIPQTENLERFDGPLDLLLALVRRNEYRLDRIPIAEITRQYNRYIQTAGNADVELGGDFIEIASWLVLLKSRALLPRSAEPPPERELERALLDHQALRSAVGLLRTRLNEAGLGAAAPDYTVAVEAEATVAAAPTVQDVLLAARRAVEAAQGYAQGSSLVSTEPWTVEAALAEVLARLGGLEPSRGISTEPWFWARPQPEASAALLLALLELARSRAVLLAQFRPFTPILLQRVDT